MVRGITDDVYIPEPDSDLSPGLWMLLMRPIRSKVISLKEENIFAVVSVAATVLIIISSYFLMQNNGET